MPCLKPGQAPEHGASHHRRFVCIVAALLAGCLGGKRPPLPTVPGTEATDLVAAIHGSLLITTRGPDHKPTRLVTISLPGRRAAELPQVHPSACCIGQSSGPSTAGGFIYVLTVGNGDRASMYLVAGRDSLPREILQRVGSRYAVFGQQPLLSPEGSAVAFLSGGKGTQFAGEYLNVGAIELWSAASGTTRELATGATDEGMAWFPNDSAIAYVTRVPRESLSSEQIDELSTGTIECANHVKHLDAVPVVYIVNAITGLRRALHIGAKPVVSSDGRHVLVQCLSSVMVSSDGHEATQVAIPGDLGRPLALLDSTLVIYWGLPTAGAKVVRSPYGSFGAGTQAVTIKVANIRTGRFQTVVPTVDPRGEVGFGWGVIEGQLGTDSVRVTDPFL